MIYTEMHKSLRMNVLAFKVMLMRTLNTSNNERVFTWMTFLFYMIYFQYMVWTAVCCWLVWLSPWGPQVVATNPIAAQTSCVDTSDYMALGLGTHTEKNHWLHRNKAGNNTEINLWSHGTKVGTHTKIKLWLHGAHAGAHSEINPWLYRTNAGNSHWNQPVISWDRGWKHAQISTSDGNTHWDQPLWVTLIGNQNLWL